MKTLLRLALVLVVTPPACSFSRDEPASMEQELPMELEEDLARSEPPPPPAQAPARSDGKKRSRAKSAPAPERLALALGGRGGSGEGSKGFGGLADKESSVEAPEPEPTSDSGEGGVRRWFPETFVFAPLVETDANGFASHEVRVPDRLTTWRVLGLAHSREGAQAGAVTSFLGTLPVYLDPVLPPLLAVKDQVEIPIQLVNTTNQRLDRTLEVSAEGGTLSSSGGPVSLPARGSVTRMVQLSADRAGTLKFSAKLTGEDAVIREVEVRPTGRPVRVEVGGTLAAPRTPKLEVPPELELGTARARLSVFPGALAILRAELGAALGRASLSDDAYLLLLAGRAEQLLSSLGVEPDRENLRRLQITAAQRAMRHNRASAPEPALLFLPGALAAKDNPVLERLGRRLLDATSNAQRGDGTFLGVSGWTVQQLLIATAEGVRALAAAQHDEEGLRRYTRARLIASGAVERMSARLEDPYTAAALLSAGLAQGELEARLQKLVRDALEAREDGTRWLVPGAGVVRSDGTPPSAVEATAYAVLGLANDAEAKVLLPDLGAALLGSYRGYGFGDGRTNLIALLAVLELFKDPLPSRVSVKLYDGERLLTEGVLEGAALKEVLVLEAALDSRPSGAWRIVADPPVPGLGYHLQLRGYVPWKDEGDRGISLSLDMPARLKLGRPVDATLRATAPGGSALVIYHALAAGMVPDAESLARLVEAGTIERFETRDGEVILHLPARAQGQLAEVRYRVIPTLAGRLRSTASRVELVDGRGERFLPPRDLLVSR